MIHVQKKQAHNGYIEYVDTKYGFTEWFNPYNGHYIRTERKKTGKDPFMRSFPALLDIGVCGGCLSSLLCKIDCYQGKRPYSPANDMKLEDYKKIINEGAKKGLQQVALGGAGNPNDYIYFKEILQYTRENDIVPNYTTSGLGLSSPNQKIVWLTKEYCGAVAVSYHGEDYTKEALEAFISAKCITNIHFVLSKHTIIEAAWLLKQIKQGKYPTPNAIVFLLYKPIGCGTKDHVLTMNDAHDIENLKEFFSKVHDMKDSGVQIGFDSCMTPGLLQFAQDFIDIRSVDTCEAGRFSAYVTPDMHLLPCSFDNQAKEYAVDISKISIEDAWNSNSFRLFREKFKTSCPNCSQRELCYGGCPLVQDIVLCNRKERITI